ncbi:hypothetical protein ONS96_009512 [Cadophora gregata f. sp. sojae]|nr:hypothetical protein ONS96_009512 [Cadophora gregata f. sp. sojae]
MQGDEVVDIAGNRVIATLKIVQNGDVDLLLQVLREHTIIFIVENKAIVLSAKKLEFLLAQALSTGTKPGKVGETRCVAMTNATRTRKKIYSGGQHLIILQHMG